MNLQQRVRKALSGFLGQAISPVGTVSRNYSKQPAFQPERQLQGITYKAIDKIGLSLSIYEPLITKRNGDAVENHPFYNVLDNPNPLINNLSDFVYLYAMLFEIYGENFIYVGAVGERDRKIKEIMLLDPSRVELKIEKGELVGYILHKNNGEKIPLEPEEVVHDKRPNPFNQWRGMSALERAGVYVDTENSTASFTLNYINNNASPSGIVSLPSMEKESFKLFTRQWREEYEGPSNAGKTAFIRGGQADFKAVGATLKDIDQKITREMAKDDVLMMFDVPKGLMGTTSDKGMGKNDLEPLEYIFAKHKLEPMMKRLDRVFTAIYAIDNGTDATIKHTSVIPEDREFKHKQNKDLVNIAVTVNEVRAQMGLEPIKGGDILNPENTVPENNKSVKVTLKKEISKAEELKKQSEEQENFRSNLIKVNEIYEIKVKRAISKHASDQQKKVIRKIDATSKSFEEWLFELREESIEMAEMINPIMLELVEEQAKGVVNFITGEPFTMTQEVKDVVRTRIVQIAGVYTEETYRSLEATLVEGQANGESLGKLKNRVEDVYDDAKGYRAERIARTESLRSSNMSAEQVYKQNGYSKVEWFINPGACEFCRTYAGMQKEIGGNFSNIGDVVTGDEGGQLALAYSDVGTPPLHPNCTCSIIPVRG